MLCSILDGHISAEVKRRDVDHQYEDKLSEQVTFDNVSNWLTDT